MSIMDDLTITRKLVVLFVVCVLLPLFVTDAVILNIVRKEDEERLRYEMGNIASAIEADIRNMVDGAVQPTKGLFINRSLNEYLDHEYESPEDFYLARYAILTNPFAEMNLSNSDLNIVMYTDNPTIVSGGPFASLKAQENEEWYKALERAENDVIPVSYYLGDEHRTETFRKRFSIVRRLNYYKDLKYEKLVKVDIDYGNMVRHFNDMKYSMPVYLCEGNRILYSNEGYSDAITPFYDLSGDETFAYENDFEVYGMKLRVLLNAPRDKSTLMTRGNIILFIVLVLVNILLPVLLMYLINQSFVRRLKTLSGAFENVNAARDSLEPIENVNGRDEIGSLMNNYNRMVVRLKELIKTVYEERLKKQETDLARQQAELLALHSQINPHFLFNVLESIRMHSIIKREDETAGMIERLAVLQRQNVDWSQDNVRIKDEIRFVEAYLDLQKYRFGDKLSYQISIRNGCENYYMPKLTLETFVENACVHGAEHKAGGTSIYVRVYEQEEHLYMEVEDTGEGMDADEAALLNEKLNNCTIDDLKTNKHVGMINACLRLKMHTNDRSSVRIESEKGVGTTILISIPIDTLNTRTIV